MKKPLVNPHDLFFRKLMKDLRIARDFFQNYLPSNILQRVDLGSLRLQSATYIDDELKEHMSDVLY